MDENKKIIWEGYGYAFGTKIPGSKYTLYSDSICVTEGILFHKEQTIPLYRIAAKEVCSSAISRLFKCGSLHLITRGREVPNVFLYVKDPQKILDIISTAEFNERNAYRKNQTKKQERIYPI